MLNKAACPPCCAFCMAGPRPKSMTEEDDKSVGSHMHRQIISCSHGCAELSNASICALRHRLQRHFRMVISKPESSIMGIDQCLCLQVSVL